MIQRKEFRRAISSGLHLLIESSKPTSDKPDPNKQQSLSILSSYTKNFLPPIFTFLLTDIDPSDRSSIENTVKSLLSISDSSYIISSFNNVIMKLLNATTEKMKVDEEPDIESNTEKKNYSTAVNLTRLCELYIDYLDLQNLDILLRTIRPLLAGKNLRLSKQAFKVFYSLCKKRNEFLKKKFDEVVQILEESTPAGNEKIKTGKYRILIIISLFEGKYNLEIHNKFLPEIILYLLVNNTKTRNSATEALLLLSKLAVKESQLPNFINTICAGLALDEHFSNASLIALTKITDIYQHLSPEYLFSFTQTISKFLKGNRPPSSVNAALQVLKSTISLLPDDKIVTVIQSLSEEVKLWNNRRRQKFIMLFAEILRESKQDQESLMKWFGFWNIVVRKVQHINSKKAAKREKRKLENKEKKKREYMDEQKPLQKPKVTTTKKKGTWIVEDNEIIDFLESSASTHVVTSNPAKKRKREEHFPVSEDGRFIIADPDENKTTESEQIEGEEPIIENSSSLDYDPLFKIMKQGTKSETKKKLSKNSTTKKVGGDVRKKNAKYEPYAYLPLKAGQLNKRRRQTAHKAYKDILTKPSQTGRGIRKRR